MNNDALPILYTLEMCINKTKCGEGSGYSIFYIMYRPSKNRFMSQLTGAEPVTTDKPMKKTKNYSKHVWSAFLNIFM